MHFSFDHTSRLGADPVDESQRQVANTAYANYMLSSWTPSTSDQHVLFATQQPAVQVQNPGAGLPAHLVEQSSLLAHAQAPAARSLDQLQLFQRPFLTVPYLGRGSVNPELESRILQGETVSEMKSVSTIMEQSFLDYQWTPLDTRQEQENQDASRRVEEMAMNGWVRGGSTTRT